MFGKLIEQAILELVLGLIVCLLFPVKGGWIPVYIIGAILMALSITVLGTTGVFGGVVFAIGFIMKVLPIIALQIGDGWYGYIGQGKVDGLRYIPLVALGLVVGESTLSFYGNGFLGAGGAIALNVAGLGLVFLGEYILYSAVQAVVLIINLVLLVLVILSAVLVIKWGGNPFDQEE